MHKNLYVIAGLAIFTAFVTGFSIFNMQVTPDFGPGAHVGVTGIRASNSLAAIFSLGGKDKTITWATQAYPASATVSINLLKKTSDSPVAYELVRNIAKNTKNDGTERWERAAGETGSDLYVEVTCGDDYAYRQGCSVSSAPIEVK